MNIIGIILTIVAVLWIGGGIAFALIATKMGGEKFVLDKNTILFILGWPFFFFTSWK